MRVLTAEAMRQLDRYAIEEVGIPGLVLMENAAVGVADAIGERFPNVDRVAILCGPGNNGGDGLAVARHLAGRGYDVEALVVDGGKGRSADFEAQLGICRRLAIEVAEPVPEETLASVDRSVLEADLIVDALFGTGLGRPLEGVFAEVVERLCASTCPIVAVDLPSGLDGGSAAAENSCLPADLTVTFAAPKVAHALAPASDLCGEIYVVDLGFGPDLVEAMEGDLRLSDADEIASLRRVRSRGGHKGSFGHLLLVAGGRGSSGAAVLAARAAGRSGVGLVTVATRAEAFDAVEAGSIESMTLELDPRGVLDGALSRKSGLVIGPGLGERAGAPLAVDDETAVWLRGVVLSAAVPAVLDAEALNAFAGRAGELSKRLAATVLTPHPGELARLVDSEVPRTSLERVEAARALALETGAVVVLKGRQTLVAEPEGEIHINTTGNSGMATGGSGDVLAGLLGGLLAQGYAPSSAARLAVYLHGLAGDLLLESSIGGSEEALVAGDLVEALPAAWEQLRS